MNQLPVSDAERDVFAAALWTRHGARLPGYVAAKIGVFAVAGDADGVQFWQDIAARADALMGSPRQ